MKSESISPERLEKDGLYREMGLSDEEFTRVKELLGRLPNVAETGVFSAMWSEHCSYKTSKPLLKRFPTKGAHVLQGPGEGAGVVDVGDNQAVVFKMESHNSPSYVEPFEGAATGVGGIVRDVFSMGAKPVALLDSLRFGELDSKGSKHLLTEVVRGIAHYGNNLGVPTVGGEIQFDACYEENPLVNAMCVGLISHDDIQKGIAEGVGNTVLYVGRDTGRDGIGGASFSSNVVEESAANTSKVAIGNPHIEKKLIDACLEVAQSDALIGMQDMGAAGLTSSASEMASASGTGIELNLDHVPQRESGMNAYDLLLSESQERMLLVVQKGREQEVIDMFNAYDVDAVAIGEVIEEEHFRIFHQAECVVDIPIKMLVDDAPVYHMPSEKPTYLDKQDEPKYIPDIDNYTDILKRILTHPSVASKACVYEQYNAKAQGNTIVEPGSDAGVIALNESKSLAMTTDGNSRYIYLDPETGGKIAVAEAARNIVCSGATPLAITDGLNYGDPTDPEVFWQMEKSIDGISEACNVLETPVISGNVSMYNQSKGEPIFPTPIVGMVGLHQSRDMITSSYFQRAGDAVYLIGETEPHFGGSVFQKVVEGVQDNQTPTIDLQKEKSVQATLLSAIKKGYIQSAHDVSDGGLGVALAECVVQAKDLGVDITLEDDATVQLFSESQTRFVISAKPENMEAVETLFSEIHCLGEVTDDQQFRINHNGQAMIQEKVSDIRNWWNNAIQNHLKSDM